MPLEAESLDMDLTLDLDVDLDDYLLHPQPPPCLRIIHACMNHARAIEHVREETVPLEDGVLRQEQLIWCIKQQQQQQHEQCKTHFKLRAMFLYNVDLETEEMPDFLREKQSSLSQRFLTPIAAVEDVLLKPTIPMFARLNALHIMYEASHHTASNQSKKRVVMHYHSSHKKQKHTRRT